MFISKINMRISEIATRSESVPETVSSGPSRCVAGSPKIEVVTEKDPCATRLRAYLPPCGRLAPHWQAPGPWLEAPSFKAEKPRN